MKKPWALIRAPYMNPTILGVIGPGFLHQVPTLRGFGFGFRSQALDCGVDGSRFKIHMGVSENKGVPYLILGSS